MRTGARPFTSRRSRALTRIVGLLAAPAVLALAGCAQAPAPDQAPALAAPAAPADMSWLPQAREISQTVPPRLLAVLQEEIARGGFGGAVEVCRDKAPALARAASEQTGWQIRRVSLRERNPRAIPDAWERAALEDFDRRAAARESAATLERAEVVMEGGQVVRRYIRALPTMELCVNCHGRPERLNPAAAARIRQLYPADRAVGYQVGEIRGAITLKRAVAAAN
ncbi:MAG: DUF3365 domain-containing protein [Burkholderiales bacterium]|nr:DUF3365 domain-containing protein [Burkholderiales bacterium]